MTHHPPPHFLRRTLLLLLLLLGAAPLRADEIQPPFGLHWGETAERLNQLLKGAKATIVDRRLVDGKEAWDVEGLLQQGLKRTVFYFHRGELVEVELQYQQEGWDDARYDSFLLEVRKKIEQRYGEGQLVAKRTEPAPDPSVTQKLVGYKWNQNNTAIELIYFAATHPNQAWRTLSVHYKFN
jgi:hypothetical protein